MIRMTTYCLTVLQYCATSVFVLTPWQTPYFSTILQQRPSPQSTTQDLRSNICRIVHQDTVTNVAVRTTSFHHSDKYLELMVIQKFHNRTDSYITINSFCTRIHSTFGEAPCRRHTSPGSQHKAFVYSLGKNELLDYFNRFVTKRCIRSMCSVLLQITSHICYHLHSSSCWWYHWHDSCYVNTFKCSITSTCSEKRTLSIFPISPVILHRSKQFLSGCCSNKRVTKAAQN